MAPDPPRDRQESVADRPAYEPPRIVVYDETALLSLIGPAVACARWTVGASPSDADEDEDF